ncbi:s-adenosylmethionine synthetase [Holotrichia oblita]|uniref:S-adenosylmethionine synthetase n=1 Tax=Holotrichia oblita TaxID=644536 RepID=A0ACB9TRR4_HOLOL|nr:s-adenosylmethionine synthetase [Holotrichia oblita]
MGFLFTSESVSEGHPDKIADQISDAILDEFLRRDPESKVACETLCTTGLVILSGEVRSEAYVDIQNVARRVIRRVGYTKGEYCFDCSSCGVISTLHEQSPDINRGVVRTAEEEQGAGDQGMMFGYACDETKELMPATLMLAHVIMKELARIRKQGEVMTYLRPDAKSQVTIEYGDDGRPLRVHTIVVSTQHDEFITAGEGGLTEQEAEARMSEKIRDDDTEEKIESAIGRTEAFLVNNGKKFLGALIVVVVVLGILMAYKYVHLPRQRERAGAMMFVAQQQFAIDSFSVALHGDGNNAGFLDIIGKYGRTSQGNVANHYAGISFMRLGDMDSALKYFARYRPVKGSPGEVINAQNKGLQGDIYVQLGQYDKAADMYGKAVDASENSLTSPYYLKKLGLVYQKLGKYGDAVTAFRRISLEFPASMEAHDIEKFIGAAEQSL